MIPPNVDVLKAVFRLQSNKDFADFLKWMEESLQRQSIDNAFNTEMVTIYQTQGRCLELIAILEHIRGSHDRLKEIEKVSPGMI